MNVDTLISEVFVRSTLWDQRDKNHHNRFVLDKLWNEVAVELNTTRSTVRKKWKSLRDKFRIILASISKTKSDDVQLTDYTGEWKYFKSLLFLKDQFTHKQSGINFPTDDTEDVDYELSNLNGDSDDANDSQESDPLPDDCIHSSSEILDSQSVVATSSASRPSTSKRRKSLLQVEEEKLKYLQSKKVKQEEDEDLNFFKSLLPHVRALSAYEKMEYRMRVMQVTQDFIKPTPKYLSCSKDYS